MKTNPVYAGLDPALKDHAVRVWRLCLLLTRNGAAADELCFQSFLRLGARSEKETRSDTVLLYSSACRLCEDWFGRKLRRAPKSEALRELFGCREGDPLDALLRQSLSARKAAGLRLAGLSGSEIIKIQGARAAARADRVSDEALAQLAAVQPPVEYVDQLSDRIYDRFSERSVGFENRLHAFRIRLDSAAPWLALLVLLFFGFCLWFVQRQ